MNYRHKTIKTITSHLLSLFPQHSFIYQGRRTGTLLLQALIEEKCSTVLMPGFICPHLSAMVKETGKKIIHLDVDPTTMHIKVGQLNQYLSTHSAADNCLLIDHSFGYVNADVELIKRQHPDLLIIEDCVRALGGFYDKKPAGSFGDWIILSMYKTVRGNEHGGILLSRTPLPCKDSSSTAYTSPREYFSTIGILRFFYDKIKCKRAPLGSESAIKKSIHYNAEPGLPSSLITYRFLYELKNLTTATKQRRAAWHHLYQSMSKNKKLEFIQILPQTKPSYHFLSFVIPDIQDLHIFLQQLNQAGYFLFNAWPDTPNYFRCFQKTFPYGDENTLYLARNIVHIPIVDFLSQKKRIKFLKYFEALFIKLQDNNS